MAIPQHVEWLLEGASAWNNRRRTSDFIPQLSGEDLAGRLRVSQSTAPGGSPVLSEVNLSRALLSDCNFSGTSFLRANFAGAYLQRTCFENAFLVLADLTQAHLQEADLTGADLAGAKLGQANLRNCKLDRTRLADADLVGADLTDSRFWRASLRGLISNNWNDYIPTTCLGGQVTSVHDVLEHVKRLKNRYTSERPQEPPIFYFRGESNTEWDLTPSVMRRLQGKRKSLRDMEEKMLVDLRTRRAEDFAEANSALEQMVIARHHGLPTRLLDVTHNPLVALFNATEGPKECPDADSRIHVFAVPPFLVKQFNSDTVSVITNFARLRRGEQNLILGKTQEDTKDDIGPAYGTGLEFGDQYELAMNRLYQFIRLEKPSFQERINPIDLLRVIVVEPQQSFERIRAQSGAFLISAFHERFEEGEIRKWTTDLPIYHHYTLTVPNGCKTDIMKDLATFNITRETMLPGLDEAAKAVTEYYRNQTS